MLRNYLKIAIRNLWKNKVFSSDQFQRDIDRTYRVTNDRFQKGKLVQHGTITYPLIGQTMAKDYDEVEDYTTIVSSGQVKLRQGKAVFIEENSLYADDHFLTFFTFPMLVGDPKTAMKTPIVFLPFYANGGYYSFKVATADLPQTIALIKQKYQTFFPGNTFSYFFMDEQFNRQYKDDQIFGKITTFFSLLAVLIASLGLFGLSSYTIAQRTKEIGIRKVLGASVASIVALLSADFLRLVLVSILIASPLAWYSADQWLQDFAYRINIPWWIFALAGLLAVLIVFLTVSFQSIKAALMNPVKSLKTD